MHMLHVTCLHAVSYNATLLYTDMDQKEEKKTVNKNNKSCQSVMGHFRRKFDVKSPLYYFSHPKLCYLDNFRQPRFFLFF